MKIMRSEWEPVFIRLTIVRTILKGGEKNPSLDILVKAGMKRGESETLLILPERRGQLKTDRDVTVLIVFIPGTETRARKKLGYFPSI